LLFWKQYRHGVQEIGEQHWWASEESCKLGAKACLFQQWLLKWRLFLGIDERIVKSNQYAPRNPQRATGPIAGKPK
jgi:hypothetical protein